MSDPLFSVEGQVVLVSGGTRGIGRGIAEGFAARGAKVWITGRDRDSTAAAAKEMSVEGRQVQGLACDVADAKAIGPAVDRVLAAAGRIDTLINCAGVNRRKPILQVSEDDYDYVVDINLKGAFLFAQAVGRAMVARGSGSIVNIASLNSDRPLKNVAPYAMSKAGITQMTRVMAVEWGPSGVRVNALAPGFILTDLTRKLWSDPTMQGWVTPNTPQRRLGTPEDMVGTAIFLSSPAAAFLTGQILFVDGGFTAGWAWPIPE